MCVCVSMPSLKPTAGPAGLSDCANAAGRRFPTAPACPGPPQPHTPVTTVPPCPIMHLSPLTRAAEPATSGGGCLSDGIYGAGSDQSADALQPVGCRGRCRCCCGTPALMMDMSLLLTPFNACTHCQTKAAASPGVAPSPGGAAGTVTTATAATASTSGTGATTATGPTPSASATATAAAASVAMPSVLVPRPGH